MSTQLYINRDAQGFPTTGQKTSKPFSDTNYFAALTQNVVLVVTVPEAPVSGSLQTVSIMAEFTFTDGANVWVLPAAAPTLTQPAGGAATLAVLNPKNYKVRGGQTLQLLTNQTNVQVSIQYYTIPN